MFLMDTVCRYPISINSVIISYVTHHRFLGIIIDRGLSWSRHLNMLKQKLNLFCHVLRFVAGLKWGPTEGSLLRLYQSLFVGYIRYCLPILSNLSISCLRTLESVQAQALKICLGLPRRASNKGTIEEARVCPLSIYTCPTNHFVYIYAY